MHERGGRKKGLSRLRKNELSRGREQARNATHTASSAVSGKVMSARLACTATGRTILIGDSKDDWLLTLLTISSTPHSCTPPPLMLLERSGDAPPNGEGEAHAELGFDVRQSAWRAVSSGSVCVAALWTVGRLWPPDGPLQPIVASE